MAIPKRKRRVRQITSDRSVVLLGKKKTEIVVSYKRKRGKPREREGRTPRSATVHLGGEKSVCSFIKGKTDLRKLVLELSLRGVAGKK